MHKKYLLAFISTAISLPCYGLGIGGINVSSNLGEPFRASINITNSIIELESDCFKLGYAVSGSDTALSSFNANLSLKKINAGDYKLFIATARAIDEPAIDLVLSSDCGSVSTRQYTVLLDPAMDNTTTALPDEQTVAELTQTNLPVAENTKPKTLTNKRRAKKTRPVTNGQMSQTIYVPAEVASSPVAPNQSVAPAQSTASGQTLSSVTASNSTSKIAPSRLVISGGTTQLSVGNSSAGANYLSLQLDNNLHEITPPTPEQLASLNDSLDDMTAMTKTIDSLKLQVERLEKRNLELELLNNPQLRAMSANQAGLKPTAPIAPDTGTAWWLYALIAGLIGVALFAFDFMRRRKRKLALVNDLGFDDFPASPAAADVKKSIAASFEHSSFGHSLQYSAKSQIEVEHDTKDDVLREVEVFMALGRNNLAIKLLQANVREFPKDSPSNWLLLLDLLKQENLPTEYAETTESCQKIFNIYVSPFADSEVLDNSSLEDHPHVEEKLEEVWGSSQMVPYLEELIYNSRSEARQGFQKKVYLELILLHKIALDRDYYDDNQISTVMSSSLPLDDKALKAKFDEVYNQEPASTDYNLENSMRYSVASDLDAEITKLEAATFNINNIDTYDLDLNLASDDGLNDQLAPNITVNPLDIPLEFETADQSFADGTLEMELAKFAAEQAEFDQNKPETNSFDLSDSLILDLSDTDQPAPVKPKKKSIKKSDSVEVDDSKPDSFNLDFKL